MVIKTVSLAEAFPEESIYFLPFNKENITKAIDTSKRVKEIQAIVIREYQKHNITFSSPGASLGRRFTYWINLYFKKDNREYPFFRTKYFTSLAQEVVSLAKPFLSYKIDQELEQNLIRNPYIILKIEDNYYNETGKRTLLFNIEASDDVKSRILFLESKLVLQ